MCGKRSKTDTTLASNLVPAPLLEPPAHDANCFVGAFDFVRELGVAVGGGATDVAPHKKSSGASSEAGKANRQVGVMVG